MSVLLADLLNTTAMSILLRMDAEWARNLATVISEFLTSETSVKLADARGSLRNNAEVDLLAAAAAFAAGLDPPQGSSHDARIAAHRWLVNWGQSHQEPEYRGIVSQPLATRRTP